MKIIKTNDVKHYYELVSNVKQADSPCCSIENISILNILIVCVL